MVEGGRFPAVRGLGGGGELWTLILVAASMSASAQLSAVAQTPGVVQTPDAVLNLPDFENVARLVGVSSEVSRLREISVQTGPVDRWELLWLHQHISERIMAASLQVDATIAQIDNEIASADEVHGWAGESVWHSAGWRFERDQLGVGADDESGQDYGGA